MKKLRDSPIAMRSSYTSVFIAAASEVIDTTEAAPNTMPDRVSSERSLCPWISRSASTTSSTQSRIAERLDRREPRRAQRGEQPGHESHGNRGPQRHRGDERAYHGGHLHHAGDDAGERGPEAEAQEPPDDRDDEDFREDVREDAARRGAERHARAELAHALHHRGEQDVGDDDAARDERHDPDDEKDEVEEQQELPRLLPRALPRRTDVEILDAMAREQQTAHLRLSGHAAYRRPSFQRQEVEPVSRAVLRDCRRNRNVGPLVAILERVVLPGREVELLPLEHADDPVALVADAHDLAQRRRRATA